MRKVLGILLVLGVLGMVQAKGPPSASGTLFVNSSGCSREDPCVNNTDTKIINSDCGAGDCDLNDGTKIINSDCSIADCINEDNKIIVNNNVVKDFNP
jgi:hypothetical protein